MSPRITARAPLAVALLLLLLAAPATCLPLQNNKLESKEETFGDAADGATSPEKESESKKSNADGTTSFTFSVAEKKRERKKHNADGGIATNGENLPDEIKKGASQDVAGDSTIPEKKHKRKNKPGEEEEKKKKKLKSMSSEDDEKSEKKSKSKSFDDDDDTKKKSKRKRSGDDNEDANKKSKRKSFVDDDDNNKKKSKIKSFVDDDNDGKKKSKEKALKSSDDSDEEKKKSKGKRKFFNDDDDDQKSKGKSQAADETTPKKVGSKAKEDKPAVDDALSWKPAAAVAKPKEEEGKAVDDALPGKPAAAVAKPKEEEEEGKSVNDALPGKPAATVDKPKEEEGKADGQALAPKKSAVTMSLPDMITQPAMHPLSPLVKMMCAKTSHPELCESSITKLPEEPPTMDAAGVLHLAINALRAKVVDAINIATDRMGVPGTDPMSKDAMNDCLQMYDGMKTDLDSAEEALKKGDKDTAHTMLDSAFTDVDTCENGFQDREGLKPLMADQDKVLTELSSNTLAIANAI
ncbi:hypothetical protein GUJ93_ZPchr0011g27262 [Zizania palustris]|uniref:Pectinesterase inhibitor domain-containing protein n=1 Tax=Zizania palustris TaxID=103762 RepID=A0A8J5WKS5_ZIZPA|nr:hypothetical protein GUJ93_ZPchr0011g27262 [Zizania palustris]